ncbi:MAG: UDP-N-acetylmuramoyl-L-alanine--D-glutamate ligase, partial [Acidobacteriota bacterium]
EENLPLLASLHPSVRRTLGTSPVELLDEVSMVVLSPGVPVTVPLVVEARRRGIPVISEVELAFRSMKGTVMAITGSNGKSTTTALVGEILLEAGDRPVVAGNIGQALTSVVDDQEHTYVVELSSFQLETVESFHANVAVLLNITPDHLDRYASMDEYAAAKYRIFRNQVAEDRAIVNADDELTKNPPTAAEVWRFSSRGEVVRGAWLAGDDLVLDVDGRAERISRGSLSLQGQANVENALASWLAARAAGVSTEAVERAFRSFTGLPHRMRLVADIGGVKWINDSKGTNVDATLKSLEGFPDGSIVLILGGRDKRGDFERMRPVVTGKVRAILTIGAAADRISEALQGTAVIIACEEMREAVLRAASLATAGDSVLLSPACASFDQYKNFEKRGEHFERLVQENVGKVGPDRSSEREAGKP